MTTTTTPTTPLTDKQYPWHAATHPMLHPESLGFSERATLFPVNSGPRHIAIAFTAEDAATIAAAPRAAAEIRALRAERDDLLAAARQVLWKVSHNSDRGPATVTREDATLKMLAAAIARAEGRAEG